MIRTPLAALVSLLLACGEAQAPAISPAAVAPPAVAPAGPSLPALASGWTVAPPLEPWLVVAEESVSLGEASAIVRLVERRTRPEDREGGESGFLVRPLHSHLSQLELPAHPLGLAIDPDVPFRTVSEILFTLAQPEWTEPMILVRRAGVVAALPIALPSRDADRLLLIGALGSGGALADVLREGAARGPTGAPVGGDLGGAFADVLRDSAASGAPEDTGAPAQGPAAEPPPEPVAEGAVGPLDLMLTVRASGIELSGSGGWLAPGCGELAPGRVVTVPVRDGAHDLAGLTRCLELVQREHPQEHRLIVSADPEIALGDVAAAIAAARGSEERPLFHHTLISAGIR